MHRHLCEVTGHYWDCPGSAVRSLRGESEPTICYCLEHLVPMEEGDHSQCSIELLACRDHQDEQLRKMGYGPGATKMPQTPQKGESTMFRDGQGNRTVGFCLWCDKDFYTLEEHEEHTANGMVACAVFQVLKDKGYMPPMLQQMVGDAALLDDEDKER
jgi:hypothetical protein